MAEEEYVYHYTNASSLLGIVSSRKIWATAHDYLNDGLEGNIVDEQLRRLCDRLSRNAAARQRKRIDALRYALEQSRLFYVASFSKNPDSLQLSRMYCPPEGGVIVGFPVRVLEELGSVRSIQYVSMQQDEWSQKYASKWLEVAAALDDEEVSARELGQRVNASGNWIWERCIQSIFQKSDEFAGEQEVRLVVTGLLEKKVRAGRQGNMLIPYTEIALPNSGFTCRLCLGPGRNWELARSSLSLVGGFARNHDTKWSFGIMSNRKSTFREL